MTNPTLKRAARAVGETFIGFGVSRHSDDDLQEAIARAVLMAVREPDELMIDAGKKDSPYVDQEDVGDIFAAMIDAILNDGEGE